MPFSMRFYMKQSIARGMDMPILSFSLHYSPFLGAILTDIMYREASNWSADRFRSANPRFSIDEKNEILFTGEMVGFPYNREKTGREHGIDF